MIKFPQVLINVGASEKLKVLREAKLKEAVDQAKHSLGESGRILVRASGTESLIRVMVEGRNRDQINVVATDVVKTIEEINAKIS